MQYTTDQWQIFRLDSQLIFLNNLVIYDFLFIFMIIEYRNGVKCYSVASRSIILFFDTYRSFNSCLPLIAIRFHGNLGQIEAGFGDYL